LKKLVSTLNLISIIFCKMMANDKPRYGIRYGAGVETTKVK